MSRCVVTSDSSPQLSDRCYSELFVVRGMLIDRVGTDFAQSALRNTDGHVSRRVRSFFLRLLGLLISNASP